MCRASKEIRFYKTQALFTYSVAKTKSIYKTQYFDCTKNKENAGNVYIKCLLYNVFKGSCAKRRHKTRTA